MAHKMNACDDQVNQSQNPPTIEQYYDSTGESKWGKHQHVYVKPVVFFLIKNIPYR